MFQNSYNALCQHVNTSFRSDANYMSTAKHFPDKPSVNGKLSCKQTPSTNSDSFTKLSKTCAKHVADAKRKAADKPLWKHILEKHGGRMGIPLFEHFSMVRTGVFVKPQRRKANEGVRISNLNPDTRMNSKDEFRQ